MGNVPWRHAIQMCDVFCSVLYSSCDSWSGTEECTIWQCGTLACNHSNHVSLCLLEHSNGSFDCQEIRQVKLSGCSKLVSRMSALVAPIFLPRLVYQYEHAAQDGIDFMQYSKGCGAGDGGGWR